MVDSAEKSGISWFMFRVSFDMVISSIQVTVKVRIRCQPITSQANQEDRQGNKPN